MEVQGATPEQIETVYGKPKTTDGPAREDQPSIPYTDDQAILSQPLLRDLDDLLKLAAESVAVVLAPAEKAGSADLVLALVTFRGAIARCRADMRKAIG
jgi:hypothetical protein